ncbi:N-6 DNA methylase [[Eubacterium] cellulosolvens]
MATVKRFIIELSGEHPELPYAELKAVLNALALKKNYKLQRLPKKQVPGRLAIVELKKDSDALIRSLSNRLAMSHNINELIARGSITELETTIENLEPMEWLRNATFKIFTRRIGKTDTWSRDALDPLRDKIIQKLSQYATVDVNQPAVEVTLYRDTELLLARKILGIPRSDFETRKPHQRPYFAPISLHPRLARCLVNLAGLKEKQVLLDPFCGTGGLLLEAGLMGLSIIGSDVDEKMVAGTRTNLEHWGIKDFRLIHTSIAALPMHISTQNSGKTKSAATRRRSKKLSHADAVVTEPPYGRASTTQGKDLNQLLENAFSVFAKLLPPAGRVVISLPEPELANSLHRKFRLLNKFNLRVHKSLTKTIFVFEKRK